MEQLYDLRGQRKYLTQHERDRFLKAARSAAPPVRAFCEILAYTGCRISEALALTPDRVDSAAGVVIFESLKKRRRGVFRAVPVPTGLLETLARLQLRNARAGLADRLWSWSRTTAWRRVRAVMRAAEVDGAAATPKGLRHAFGIVAVAAAVPLTIIQKWMGHSDVSTTAIYLDASGSEERRIAAQIYVIRGEQVMLDSDLAELYGVPTKRLNEQVSRNLDRFPEDFMFQLTRDEFANLKSQIATSSWGGRRTAPRAFTEHGVAMLSAVLRSRQAVQVSLAVVRTFVRLRRVLLTNEDVARKVAQHDEEIGILFEHIQALLEPPDTPEKPRIGSERRTRRIRGRTPLDPLALRATVPPILFDRYAAGCGS